MKIMQKRKGLAACLAVIMCITLSLPSFAIHAQDEETLDTDYTDNVADTTVPADADPTDNEVADNEAANNASADNELSGDENENSEISLDEPDTDTEYEVKESTGEEESDSLSSINLLSTTHDMSTGSLHVLATDSDITVTGTYTPTTSGHAIEVDAGYTGTITLNNVNIDVSSYTTSAAFLINGSGSVGSVDTNVNVELVGTNYLTSGYLRAGLEVWTGAQVEIGGSGTLYAECGDNTSYYSCGAGIGAGNVSGSGGNVVIRGGNIYATAGYHGAGIGGSWITAGAYDGTIIIYGGNVVSNGGTHGAGIGGGCANSLFGYANTGTILVLPPADVTASSDGIYETVGEMNTTVYVGDPRSPVTTARTSEYTVGADIYMNLINVTDAVNALSNCGISTSEVDLTKIKLGTTDSSGIASIHMEINESVNFYTDAVSTSGLSFQSYETTVSEAKEIVLNAPILDLTASNLTSTVPDLKSGYTTVPDENIQTIELTNSGGTTIANITLTIEAPYDSLFEIVSIDKTALLPGEKATVLVRPLTGLTNGTHNAKLRVLGEVTDGTGGAAVQLTMERYVDLAAQSVSQQIKFDAGTNGTITSGDDEYWLVAGNTIAEVPTVTANSGYTFKGWTLDGSIVVDPTTVTVDAETDYVFTALYTTVEQAVTNTDTKTDNKTGAQTNTIASTKTTSSPNTGDVSEIRFVISLITSLLIIVGLWYFRRRYIIQMR